MPVIKSAKKKLRQDKKRQVENKGVKNVLKSLLKAAKIEKTAEAVRKAVQATDKAAKKRIIHKNKAAHIKSSLSQLLGTTSIKAAPATKKTSAKVAKKSPTKKKK